MYVWDTFRKATLRVIHLRCGFCSNFLGVTGMMARLDVLKFTPSPKKRKLGQRHIWQWTGKWVLGYAIWKWDLNRLPHRFTEGPTVFLFGWTISSLMKLILHFTSCLVCHVTLGALLFFIISMYLSFFFFFFMESRRDLGGKNKK